MLFVLYPLGRFVIEFLRDDDRGTIFFLSVPQVISVFVALAAFGFLFARRREFGFADRVAQINL